MCSLRILLLFSTSCLILGFFFLLGCSHNFKSAFESHTLSLVLINCFSRVFSCFQLNRLPWWPLPKIRSWKKKGVTLLTSQSTIIPPFKCICVTTADTHTFPHHRKRRLVYLRPETSRDSMPDSICSPSHFFLSSFASFRPALASQSELNWKTLHVFSPCFAFNF